MAQLSLVRTAHQSVGALTVTDSYLLISAYIVNWRLIIHTLCHPFDINVQLSNIEIKYAMDLHGIQIFRY